MPKLSIKKMGNRWFETLIGFVVVAICLSFSYRIYKVTSGNIATSLEVNRYRAKFSNVEGIAIGSDVKIGGLKVGSVVDIVINEDLGIEIEISVRNNIHLPVDSKVLVTSSGLLGGKYIEIKPGVEEEFMKDGSFFQSSQSALSIEALINRFAFK